MAPKQPPLIKKVLFDFSNLNISIESDSSDESELSDLPSDFGECYEDDEAHDQEDDDEWYELSDTKDKEEELAPILPPPPILPPTPTPILLGAKPPPLPTAPKKEHTIGARIRAVTMMDDGIAITRITKVTGIPRTRIYELHALARERGWVEKTKSGDQMILEPHHVANAP